MTLPRYCVTISRSDIEEYNSDTFATLKLSLPLDRERIDREYQTYSNDANISLLQDFTTANKERSVNAMTEKDGKGDYSRLPVTAPSCYDTTVIHLLNDPSISLNVARDTSLLE